MQHSASEEALSGAGQRQNYATDENLRKRQGLWAFVDPAMSIGGLPVERLRFCGEETVLDVGCGNGIWLSGLRPQVGTVIGVDLSLGMLHATRARLDGDTAALAQTDVQALPVATGSVDVVLALHILYHLPDQPAAIAELHRVLRPGGTALVSTNSPSPTPIELLGRQVVAAALGRPEGPILPELSFTSDNGEALLAASFDQVRPAWHTSGQRITDPDALVSFLDSVRGPIELYLGTVPDWDVFEKASVNYFERSLGVVIGACANALGPAVEDAAAVGLHWDSGAVSWPTGPGQF